MKSPQELWPDIVKGNDRHARSERRAKLNTLRNRISDWTSVLERHPDGGPNKQEMAGIVADITEFIAKEVRD